jgi:hypothetical protein
MWRNDSDQKYQLCYSIAFCQRVLLTARGVLVVQRQVPRLAAAGRARAARGPARACLLAVGTGRTRPPACARVCAPRAAYRLPACAESAKSGAVHSGGVYSTGSTLRFM